MELEEKSQIANFMLEAMEHLNDVIETLDHAQTVSLDALTYQDWERLQGWMRVSVSFHLMFKQCLQVGGAVVTDDALLDHAIAALSTEI